MGDKVKGTLVYVEVWTGVWTPIGYQKDCTIDRGKSSIDVTNKDSGGWEESLDGYKNWAISFDAFLVENDAGLLQIESDFENDIIQNYRITTPAHVYVGKAVIEGLSFTGPDGDASVVSFTLKGTAALVKT